MQIAIIDADLIGRKRHRFPNLACMKLSGYHKKKSLREFALANGENSSVINAAANVLSSGELLATTNRYGRGIFANGASSFADIGGGGADSVFTRIVFDNQVGNERRYGSFGDYVFIFDTKTLERTDWYAYTYDEFGTTRKGTFDRRNGTEDHFKQSRNSYSRSNELLFRKTLPLDTLTEVRVPSSDRQALIDKLHSVGISQINGIRLEDLIKVGGRMV